MKKKYYIQPLTKIHLAFLVRHLMNLASEQGSNSDDWNSKQGFFDDDEESSAWGNVWK